MPRQTPAQSDLHAGKEGGDGASSCSFLKEKETALSTRQKSCQAEDDTKPIAKQQCIDLHEVSHVEPTDISHSLFFSKLSLI